MVDQKVIQKLRQDVGASERKPFDVNVIGDEVEKEITRVVHDPLLRARQGTHGSFDENARVWQALCTEASRTQFVNDRQRLAFNMLALKFARLLQNPDVKDHWDDIAGYAKLGAEACGR